MCLESCGLRTILGSLSADGWGHVPTILVVRLRHFSSTETCRLLGGARSLMPKWWPQESSHWWIFPVASATSVPCSLSEPQITPLPKEIHRSGSASYEVTPLPWFPVHMKASCTLQEWNLCFPSPAEFPASSPVAFKTKCFGVLLLMPDTQGGEPHRALRNLCRECLWYSCFNLWVAHPGAWDLVIFQDLYILSSCGFYIFGCRVSFFFWYFQVTFFNDCSSVGCWYFHERRWSQVLLLHHLVSSVSF